MFGNIRLLKLAGSPVVTALGSLGKEDEDRYENAMKQ